MKTFIINSINKLNDERIAFLFVFSWFIGSMTFTLIGHSLTAIGMTLYINGILIIAGYIVQFIGLCSIVLLMYSIYKAKSKK